VEGNANKLHFVIAFPFDCVIRLQMLIFSMYEIARLSTYWLQIKVSMSLFFYCFTFSINFWHLKFVTARPLRRRRQPPRRNFMLCAAPPPNFFVAQPNSSRKWKFYQPAEYFSAQFRRRQKSNQLFHFKVQTMLNLQTPCINVLFCVSFTAFTCFFSLHVFVRCTNCQWQTL